MVRPLAGKCVLITGASRGLGAQVARAFAQQGCHLALNYLRSQEAAEALAQELTKVYSVQTICFQGDVAEEATCIKLVHETWRLLGGLDIIISNAGWTKISDWTDLTSMSCAEWDLCWKVNVLANMILLREAKPFFLENQDGGSLIMTSSTAADVFPSSSMPYAVSKAAQHFLMRCLAKTQGPKIRVCAVKPGFIATDWGLGFGEEYLAEAARQAPLQKLADLEDCASAFLYLAQNASMTGQAITVDGGESLK